MAETRLRTLADDLLDGVVAAAAALAIELPARQVIADGAVAWDCAMVAVALPQITRGVPSADTATANRQSDTYVAQYAVWLLREVPGLDSNGNPPAPELVSASGRQLMDDGYLLTVGMRQELHRIGQSCTSMSVGTTTAQGPQGGLAGWQSLIRIGV